MNLKLILLSLISFSALAQADCVLKLDKDSIRVFTCKTNHSKFKSIKTSFTVNATPAQLKKMVFDIDRLGEWQYKTVSARLLKKNHDREIIYHTEVSVPVADNRDFVIRLTLEEPANEKEFFIRAVSIPNYIPANENIVRVPMSSAVWKVRSIGPKKLRVDYSIDIDMGGALPAWVVNSLSHKAPYETFKALKEKVGGYK